MRKKVYNYILQDNQFGFSLLKTSSSKRSASKAFNNEVMKTTSSSMKKQRCKFIFPGFFSRFPRLMSIS